MRAVNLIPSERRKGASVGLGRSQGAAYALLVIVFACAVLAFLYGGASHQISSRQAQITTLTAQAQQAQSDAVSLAQYESLNATREKRLKAVEALVNSRFDWAHTLHEFGRVLPAGVSISALAGAIAGGAGAGIGTGASAPAATPAAKAASAVTSATPPGSVPTFTLTGCARNQAQVAQALERLRLIDGVKEVTLQSSTSAANGAGGCPGADPSFTAAITFSPLPSEAAYSVKAVADNGAAGGVEPQGRVK